ncbi:MAG: HAD hydrolase-like protein [Oceanococcaceae bacterium]
MTAGPFRIVFFDLDGTLVDTAPEAAEALNRTLQRHGVPAVQPEQVRRWFGHGMIALLREALETVAAGIELPPREVVQAEFAAHYRDTSGQRSVLYPAVPSTLAALGERGIRRVLITNKEEVCAARVIDSHGIAGLFDAHVFGDTFRARKPDPGGVIHYLDAWSIPARAAVLVGDSEVDLATGRNAGTAVWLASYGYMRGGDVAAAGADRVVDRIDALLDL